ncbi:hypothetical protein VFPFJ_06230 [Purpureocillium lilacinum]|uniref:Uncharacterized protein n=1 Tax=Purpureocillium lilacinum TaxID=33203 RepID=A0A179HHB6_PURLI|nr:hypothetical protein VFPFJ_06230 [Purpureocillium lilacinum]OAQ67369.1 hypothetical protein VFPBJ_10964 [Purpureocillium lilacinum]OAQ89816.1 hypothetical protein VFPFJ_06230 [Purpureocillium lilacinum]
MDNCWEWRLALGPAIRVRGPGLSTAAPEPRTKSGQPAPAGLPATTAPHECPTLHNGADGKPASLLLALIVPISPAPRLHMTCQIAGQSSCRRG